MNLVEKSLSLRIFLKHVFIEVNRRKLKLQDINIFDWQSRGRRFESDLLHFLKETFLSELALFLVPNLAPKFNYL